MMQKYYIMYQLNIHVYMIGRAITMYVVFFIASDDSNVTLDSHQMPSHARMMNSSSSVSVSDLTSGSAVIICSFSGRSALRLYT